MFSMTSRTSYHSTKAKKAQHLLKVNAACRSKLQKSHDICILSVGQMLKVMDETQVISNSPQPEVDRNEVG